MKRPGELIEATSLTLGSLLCITAALVFLNSLPSVGALSDGSLLSMWALSSLGALAAMAGTGIVFLKVRLP